MQDHSSSSGCGVPAASTRRRALPHVRATLAGAHREALLGKPRPPRQWGQARPRASAATQIAGARTRGRCDVPATAALRVRHSPLMVGNPAARRQAAATEVRKALTRARFPLVSTAQLDPEGSAQLRRRAVAACLSARGATEQRAEPDHSNLQSGRLSAWPGRACAAALGRRRRRGVLGAAASHARGAAQTHARCQTQRGASKFLILVGIILPLVPGDPVSAAIPLSPYHCLAGRGGGSQPVLPWLPRAEARRHARNEPAAGGSWRTLLVDGDDRRACQAHGAGRGRARGAGGRHRSRHGGDVPAARGGRCPV